MSSNHLLELAHDVVRKALDRGASDAEVTVAEGSEFSTSVRMREVETIKEAGSRAIGVRVLKGRNPGSSYTSDFSAEAIDKMVETALSLAAVTSADPHAGLPDPEELGRIDGDLRLHHDDVGALAAPEKIALARRAEAAALDFDSRIDNSDGAGFDTYLGRNVFVNSRGFAGEYRTSSCSMSAMPIARLGDHMERDHWFDWKRSFAELDTPEAIGRIAAERTVRRLGATKVETQKVPIVFDPGTARSLLGSIFEAVSGDTIYRQASFLAGKLGEKIAADSLNVIDDGTIAGRIGTSPYDDEGVPTRRTVVIERGVLKSYLLNAYTARKLGLRTTGNAARGITGNAGIGHGNFFVEPGALPPDELIRGIANGFYVTELMGFGVNLVTGDWSHGASGIWIRGGELAFPVNEVTIAGNLSQMLLGIEWIGSDLNFRGSTASPTLCVREMTVAGK